MAEIKNKCSKRRKIMLSLEDKLEVIEMLKKGSSYSFTFVSEKFGIG